MNGPSRVHYRRARADWLSFLLQGELRTATANSDAGSNRTASPRCGAAAAVSIYAHRLARVGKCGYRSL